MNVITDEMSATDIRKMFRKLQLNHIELEKQNEKLRNDRAGLEQALARQKKAESDAAQSAHLASLGELAAGIAHEINNPVNGIINYAQMLSDRIKPGCKEHDIAVRIIKESDRIAAIVKNLLTYVREEYGEKRPLDIHELLSVSLSLSRTQLMKDSINVRVDIPEKLPPVNVQPQQIEQVFLNIISNSRYALNRKYPGQGGDKIIEISGEKTNNNGTSHVQITFFDNGTGIPAGIIDKIMNPLFTTKPCGEGTGLGLSISRGIINNHCGNLKIQSVEEEYTKVIISLPVSD